MSKTRLSTLPKKDRDYVDGYLADRPHLLGNLTEIVADRARTARATLGRWDQRPVRQDYAYKTPADLIASDLHFLASGVLEWGIAQRLVHENICDLRRAISLHGRLRYLKSLYRTSAEGLHLAPMMASQAVADDVAVQAFASTQPIASKSAHPSNRIVCNLLTLAVSPSAELEVIVTQPRPKVDLHTGHVADALEALLRDDEIEFRAHISQVAATHRRVSGDGLLRYLSITAHGLTSLAVARWNRSVSDLISDGPAFDLELHAAPQPDLNTDVLAIYSPLLAKAVEELPPSIDLGNLSPSGA